jgi:DeoR/GlpR family transcriptional regulator of sugar metabolism
MSTINNIEEIVMSTTTETLIRPYTIGELAALYGVTTKTIRRWLNPHKEAVGTREGRYYTALQIQQIFDRLGQPAIVE